MNSVLFCYQKFIIYGSSFWVDSTKVYYEKALKFFFDYLEYEFKRDLEFIFVQELDRTLIFSYVRFLRDKNKYNRFKENIKANTVRNYMRAVKCFVNFLYNEDYLQKNILKGLKLPKSDDSLLLPLSGQEVQAIDSVFKLDNHIDLRAFCMYRLMLCEGLRQSEVINLKVDDILFDKNIIMVKNSKCSKSRFVILDVDLKVKLLRYIDIFKPIDYLFYNTKKENQEKLTTSAIRRLIDRIIFHTNITRLHAHLFRHTFATSFLLGGGNLEVLRLLLGHYDYTVTRKYLHLSTEMQFLNNDIFRLNDCFFKIRY